MFKKRTLAKTILQASKSFPVILVTGPRQIGKTTLLEALGEARRYVSLDDFVLREMAQNDPALFLEKHPPPIIIDEVQYAPKLFTYIKIIVDKEKKPGLFWLTGSQKFGLMKGITESLAGRVAIIDMLGLSQAEIEGRELLPFTPQTSWVEQAAQQVLAPKKLMDIYTNIWRGAFPQLVVDKEISRDLFYKSYVETYIQRDVRDITNIENELTFRKFIQVMAARTGQLLNYSDIARDVAIDHKTAKAWLSILEASGLVYLLYPYYRNVTKRLIKTPKLYFLDTGLCAFLTGWHTPESLEAGAMSGAILETYIFTEILKTYWHNGRSAAFYFYRDIDQKEIDLIIEEGDTLYPVEFKKTAMPSLMAAKQFPILGKLERKIGHGAVVCLRDTHIPLSREVEAIPVSYF